MTLTRERLNDFLCVVLLSAIASIYFADVIRGSQKLYLRDLTRYYYPTKKIVRDVILSGEFPYWNRFYSAGQPMAANPEYEVFYPPQWLILLPSYDLGFRLHILFHVYLALIGMYALLRSMGLRAESSLFGSLSFGMGGVFLSLVNLLPQMFCTAWMPLIFLFARRFLLRPNPRDFALTSIFLGIQALAGEPMTMAQTGFLIGAYGLYRAWYGRRRILEAIRNTVAVAAIGVSGVLVGAAQMIPAIDHAADSVRSRPFEFSLVTSWSMPLIRPLELIFPNVLGHLSRERIAWYWAGGLYSGMGSPFLFSVYVGLLACALFVAGAFVRPRGGRLVLIITAISVLLALGSNTPLFHFLYRAGVASSIRYPEKFALMAMFTLIVFASMMFERLLDGDRKVRDAASGFLLGATLFAVVAAIITFTPVHAKIFTRLWGPSPPRNLRIMLAFSQADWVTASAKGVVLLALLWGTARPRFARFAGAALIAFLLVDLVPVTRELIPRMPPNFFTAPPLVRDATEPSHTFRIFHESDWYGTSEIAKGYFSTADAVYWIVRNGMFPMTTATWGFHSVLERDYDKTALLTTVDLVDALWKVKDAGREDWREIFAAMSNASYRTEYRPIEPERKRVRGDMKKANPLALVALEGGERYYFADQLVRIRGVNDFTKQLSTRSWSRKVAFVDFEPFSPARATVNLVRESANDASIDVRAAGVSYLVMSVTPHKYWSATLDGKPTRLHVTNIGYQGMIVPAGTHRIEMKYRNSLVPLSSGISVASLLLFSFVAAKRTWLKREGGDAPESSPAIGRPVSAEAPTDQEHIEEHSE